MAERTWCAVISLWFVCSALASIQNYETVTIDECVPGKYFWRESKPQEFYACLTLSKKAVKMRCLQGKYMCNSGPKVFQPCMCTSSPEKQANPPNDPDSSPNQLKDGHFSQFAKMGPGGATDDQILDRMRQEVNAAMLSTPPPSPQDDPIAAKMRSLPARGCPDAYKKFADTHMLGGMRQENLTRLIDCQRMCLMSSDCVGVDWNKESNRDNTDRCYFISPQAAIGFRSRMKNTCCDHYRRTLCNATGDGYYQNAYVRVNNGGGSLGFMEMTQPTAPRAITTTTDSITPPLADSTTTIPDSGCPYSYQEFPGVSHPFGQNVTEGLDLDDPEECKYWCLVRSYCKGVDFDANTNTCYYLAQVEPPLVTRGVSGVTHYRKVDCTSKCLQGECTDIGPLRCFVSSTEVRSPLDMAITDPRTGQTQCNGVCYTRETIGATTNTVDRGCMTASVPVTLGCQLSDDLLTITCFCDTMRCNALSVVAMATQLLHMPLDDDLSDHSGTSNSADVPENYSPPDFQCLDKAVNCSALFTGNQCIRVTSLTNTDFGVVGQDFRFSPEATFSVYFKRVTTSGPAMEGGIFGNSDDANVKPTWQIAAKQFDNYTTAGLTSEDTQLASLLDYDFVRADNDKWHLMVMTYEGLFDYTRRMFPKLSLYLDGQPVDGNSMLEQGKIAISSLPVTVGCVAGSNFFGYIDEARIFVTSLSMEDITALHVMRDENFWY